MLTHQKSRPALLRTLQLVAVGGALAALPVSIVSAQTSTSGGSGSKKTAAIDPATPNAEKPKLSPDEQAFVKMAGGVNLAEIDAAKLAAKNTKNKELQERAAKVAADHTKANMDLAGVAKRGNLKDYKPMLSDEQQAAVAKLKALKNEEFDTAYNEFTMESHKKAITEYRGIRSSLKNKDLLDYVSNTEDVLNKHESGPAKTDKPAVNQ